MKWTTFWGVKNEFLCFNSYYHRSPQESQKTKKADLAPKTNSNPNFESRFGFLVKFYHIPEFGYKKSGLELKKMNLYPFFFISGPLCPPPPCDFRIIVHGTLSQWSNGFLYSSPWGVLFNWILDFFLYCVVLYPFFDVSDYYSKFI